MRLLLDTHILLAMFEEGDVSLPARYVELLGDPDCELLASTASIWEIALKVRNGRLGLGMALSALPDACRAVGVDLLVIAPQHVLAVVTPEPSTRDPFDRLPLAQAQCEGMGLLTLDRALVQRRLAWTDGG